jgi:hypothetical protein
MCCDPEVSWEEPEPVLVVSATVIDLHDLSINYLFATIGEMGRVGNGDRLQPGALYCEMGTYAHEEGATPVGTQLIARPGD